LVTYLESNPDIAFVYSNCKRVDETGAITGDMQGGPPAELRFRNCVGACFLYRRKVYDCIGDYNVNAELSEDYEYWLRVYLRFCMAFLNEALYYYRDHHTSLSSVNYGYYRACRVAVRVRKRLLKIPRKEFRKQMAHWFIAEAFDSYTQGDLINAWQKGLSGIVYNPASLQNRGLLKLIFGALAGKPDLLT